MAEVFGEAQLAAVHLEDISAKAFLASDDILRQELENFIAIYGADDTELEMTFCVNLLETFSLWSLEIAAGFFWTHGYFRDGPMFLGNFLDSLRYTTFYGEKILLHNENYHDVLDRNNFQMNYFLSDFGKIQSMLLTNNQTNMVDLGIYFLRYIEQKHSYEEKGKSGCTGDAIVGLSHLSTSFCTEHENNSCCYLEKLLSKDYEQVYSFKQYVLDSLSTRSANNGQGKRIRKMTEALSTSSQEPFAFNLHPLVPACKFGTSFEKMSSDCQYFSVTYSTDGLGYSFNSVKMFDQYHAYRATKAFHKNLVSEKNQEKAWERLKEVGKSHNKVFELLVSMPKQGISYSKIGFDVGDDVEGMHEYEQSMIPSIQVSGFIRQRTFLI